MSDSRISDAVWQFNEAVSMLNEINDEMGLSARLAEEIRKGLPAMMAALRALAALDSHGTVASDALDSPETP